MKEQISFRKKIATGAAIEDIITKLNLPPELAAMVMERCAARSSKGIQIDSVCEEVIRKARDILKNIQREICDECRLTPPQQDKKLIGIYTGQFNPPTKGHEAFLRHLREQDFDFIIVGPDAERAPETERLGGEADSGFTPMALRRFIFEEFMRRVFKNDLETGKFIFYPPDLTGGDFLDRIRLWRARFDGVTVFCTGADTLRDIIVNYPEAVLEGPIVCMRRTEKGKDITLPLISSELFLELMQDVMKKIGPNLALLFKGHSYIEPLLSVWCEEFPNMPPPQIDDFLRRQKVQPADFANRLFGSERLGHVNRRLENRLKRSLEKFIVYAHLFTDPFKLKQLQSHILYVPTEEQPSSSTRDRQLFAGLPPAIEQFRSVLLGEQHADGASRIAKLLRRHCETPDWDKLNSTMQYLNATNPAGLAAGISQIVHGDVLEILYEHDLLDMYSSREQKIRVPVSSEVVRCAIPCSEKFGVIHPEQIQKMPPSTQYHFARSLAGVHFEWKHDHPDRDMFIPKKVLFSLAHPQSARNFLPSVLIDFRNRHIVALMAAYRMPARASIKYTAVTIDPRYSRDPQVADFVNRFIKDRIYSDREGDRYPDVSLMLAEVPAHDTRFIEQYILGGTKFIPCGLEPEMDMAHSYVSWTVQGMHIRNPQFYQGDYYVVPEAADLIKAVNDVVSEIYGQKMKYNLVQSAGLTKVGNFNGVRSKENPVFLRESKEEFIYKAGQASFSIYPGRSRHFEIDDFQDPVSGVALLDTAIETALKLFEEGKLGCPYLKIAIPVDSPHLLNLQRLLIERGFYPVRFIPRTNNRPPALTFCCILGKPRMNGINLPLARIAGDPHANQVFLVLQKTGEKLCEHGKLTSEEEPTTFKNIRHGREEVYRASSMREIIIKNGYWDVFPSLYAHFHETIQTLHIVNNNIDLKYAPAKILDLPEADCMKFMRRFVGLHDAGKAIWAMANRFAATSLKDVCEPLSDQQLARRFRKFLTGGFESGESFSGDWKLERADLDYRKLARYLHFDGQDKRYKPFHDSDISAQLIDGFLKSRTTDSVVDREHYPQCARLYRLFADGHFDRILEYIDENSSDIINLLLSDRDMYVFILLELIDNTARYRITTHDGTISLRDIGNVLDLKKQEVLRRYGHEIAVKDAIQKKFRILKRAAEVLFGSPITV